MPSQVFARFLSLLLLPLLVLAFGACSEVSDPVLEKAAPTEGTLRIQLVDTPACIENLEAVFITFEKVLVHVGCDDDTLDGEWVQVTSDTLAVEDRTFELLSLVAGNYAVLGSVDVPAGHYTQIRAIIESASIVIAGETHDLQIPSGAQSGLKLISGFDILPGVVTELTLDFDVCQSIFEVPSHARKYKLKPTIRLVATAVSGSISGTVLPPEIGAWIMGISEDTSDTTTTFVEPITGTWMLMGLPAGAYTVQALAPGHVTASENGVEVIAGQCNEGHDFVLEPEAVETP